MATARSKQGQVIYMATGALLLAFLALGASLVEINSARSKQGQVIKLSAVQSNESQNFDLISWKKTLCKVFTSQYPKCPLAVSTSKPGLEKKRGCSNYRPS